MPALRPTGGRNRLGKARGLVRGWSLILIAALGVSAVAGGDDGSSDATTTAGDSASTTDGASGDPDAALVEAATAEGKITIYSSQGLDQLNALAADFEAAYPGIDAEVVRGIDGDLAPKVEAENQTRARTPSTAVMGQ